MRTPSAQKLRLRLPEAGGMGSLPGGPRPTAAAADEMPAPQRSKLTSPQVALTPRLGRRSGKLPVAAGGNDALLGARLGIYSEADAMMHRVRNQLPP